MKNLIVIVSVFVTAISVALLFELKTEADAATVRAAAAESRGKIVAAEAERLENQGDHLRQQLRTIEDDLRQKSSHPSPARAAFVGTTPATDVTSREANVFRDPEMKQVLLDDAKSGVARNIKALLEAGLAKHLKLDATQTAQLEQLLSAKASIFWEQMLVPLMTENLDAAAIATSGKAARDAFENNKNQLKTLLGEEGYATYEWFDKTQDQRDSLKRLHKDLEKSGVTLNDETQNQLLTVMIEERLNFPFQHDIDPNTLDFERWPERYTEANLNAFFTEKAQFVERVVQRAQPLLTSEQSKLLKDSFANQLLRAKFTARATTAMFARQK